MPSRNAQSRFMENVSAPATVNIEVAYALPHKQQLIPLQVCEGTTIAQAIQDSGLLELFPDIDLTKNKVGIFGKLKTLETEVHDGDRVEIYRPLIADPKEVRKRRAAEGKRMRKGGGEVKEVKATDA